MFTFVCLLLSAHRAVIFAISHLSCSVMKAERISNELQKVQAFLAMTMPKHFPLNPGVGARAPGCNCVRAPTRAVFLFVDASGRVRFWHCSSRKCLVSLNEDRPQTLSMAFSSPAERFATVGDDPKVFVYDLETKTRVAELEATYVNHHVVVVESMWILEFNEHLYQ